MNAKSMCGTTPLHNACKRGCLSTIKLLLSHGANVNAKDKYGKIPLSNCHIKDSKIDVFYELLNAGSYLENDQRDKIIPISVTYNHMGLFKILVIRGGIVKRHTESYSMKSFVERKRLSRFYSIRTLFNKSAITIQCAYRSFQSRTVTTLKKSLEQQINN